MLCNEDMPRSSGIKDLSISPENSGITNLSAEQLERIWEKAKELLNTEGNICSAPRMCDTLECVIPCVLPARQTTGLILFQKLRREA